MLISFTPSPERSATSPLSRWAALFQYSPPQKQGYSTVIDAMRIVVAMLLVVGHLGLGRFVSELTNNVLLSGFASAIFFLLSGFVIANSSLFRESWFGFAAKRIARLWPPHVVAFLTYLPFLLIGADRKPFGEVLEMTAVWGTGMQGLSPFYAFGYNVNAPAWSVTALLIGGILLPVLAFVDVRRFSARMLWLTLGAFVALRMAIEIFAGVPLESEIEPRHIAVIPRVLAMFSGALMAIILEHESHSPRLQWLRSNLALVALSVTIVAMLFTAGYWQGRPGLYMVAHGGMIIPTLLLITAAYLNRDSLHHFCARPIFKLGADLSIYIFLFHIPVSVLLLRIGIRLERFGIPFVNTESIPGICLTIVLTCLVSYWFLPLGRRMQTATANALMKLQFSDRESERLAKSAAA